MSATPRVVVVTRPTELEQLLARHGTREQARFRLRAAGSDVLDAAEERHAAMDRALTSVSQAIPTRWRRSRIDRAALARFVWEPNDLVVAVGQDGLVANVAKYLAGQLVIGLNPDPTRFDGVLVKHSVDRLPMLLGRAAERRVSVESRSLVEARVDDGQVLRALNEVFVGHRSHQSARYRIRVRGAEERHSSSGLIVATGTGATGWARSIAFSRNGAVALPNATDERLAFFVREAFPSRATGTSITQGQLAAGEELTLVSELDEGGVVFGDGIEDDRLRVGWGQVVSVRRAPDKLNLVTG
ncbi:MAG: hypothetical protein U0271_23320 [Polyangiaceae bacterium]